jgi:hypothetical protein
MNNALAFFQTLKLSVLGGKDIPMTGKAILENLLTPEMAQQFNWTGVKGKKAFQSLSMIIKVILREYP